MLPELPSALSSHIPQEMPGERTVLVYLYCHWLGEVLQEIPAFRSSDWTNALNNRQISSSLLLHHFEHFSHPEDGVIRLCRNVGTL
jgi:hypothetical protein